MEQVVLFEIATSGAPRLVWAKVMETWLEFPDSSGKSLNWRAPFSDPSARSLRGKRPQRSEVESPGVVAGETLPDPGPRRRSRLRPPLSAAGPRPTEE